MDAPARHLVKKACLLGDFSVGKTSLVRRCVEGRFDERYLSTLGVKVDRKVLRLPGLAGEVELSLMLWDLAGGPEVGPLSASYYRGAAGAIVVCDLARPETLQHVDHYVCAFRHTNPSAHLVLAANKVDLAPGRGAADPDLAAVAAQAGAPAFFLTSAKTGEQVEALFEQLGRLLVG